MAFVTIEDLTGSVEMVVSSKIFVEVEEIIKQDAPLLITLVTHSDRDEEGGQRQRIRCTGARQLAEVREKEHQVGPIAHAGNLGERRQHQ